MTKQNAIFGRYRCRMFVSKIAKHQYISGRGCRAHADYHSRHNYQQYWQSLLSQYIQVYIDRDNLVWEKLIILLIRSIKFHLDTEIFKNSKEKAELVRDFLMDSETFDDNSKSDAALVALTGWNGTLLQFFVFTWGA